MRAAVLIFGCALFSSALIAQSPSMSHVHVDVATIKPTPADTQDEFFTIRGHHAITIGTSLIELVKFVYGLHPSQIAAVQPWMTEDRFDIDAVVDTTHDLTNDDMRDVVRDILADRFHLQCRMETTSLPVFVLQRSGTDLRMKRRNVCRGRLWTFTAHTVSCMRTTRQCRMLLRGCHAGWWRGQLWIRPA